MRNREIRNQARYFKALSCETRLEIVLLLYDRDLPVNGLVSALRKREPVRLIDRTGVSKHLAVLRRLGIVSSKVKGQKRIYRLEARCLVEAVGCTAALARKDNCCAPRNQKKRTQGGKS